MTPLPDHETGDASWESSSAKSNEDDGQSSTEFVSGRDDEENELQITTKETKAVFGLRLLFFLVLVASGIAVCLIVYYVSFKSVEEKYETLYYGAADRVVEAFMDIADSKLAALTSLGVTLSAHGSDFSSQWPFVTLSSFQQRASTALKQSGALSISLVPEVTSAQRLEWENFTVQEKAWIDEAITFQDEAGINDIFKQVDHTLPIESTMKESIWYFDSETLEAVEDESQGPYFPIWQTSPVLDGGASVNENLVRVSGSKGVHVAHDNDKVVISEFLTAPQGDIHHENPLTSYFALAQSVKAGNVVEYQGDPVSRVFFPVFDGFEDGREHVAIMVAYIRWASFFENILPENVEGVTLVLNDSCGGTHTFEVAGSRVIYIGKGDLHDRAFGAFEKIANFDSVANIEDGTKYGIPLDNGYCRTELRVYASDWFEGYHHDKSPIWLAWSVAAVFLFTILLFMIYNYIVEHRQALLLRQATQSSAIVSSLFPNAVRDRLLKSSTIHNSASKNTKQSLIAPTNRLKGYLNGGNDDMDEEQPIADLFPYCTVLFADIAGFTAWSSTREPAQVFILLQTVYQAYDVIAKRRKVFKVETIGDSYVAVTGLPEEQPKHAVIMARFAHDCMLKMKDLVHQLESTLGPDTTDLCMRIGMHSGPVTAGVLRGDRARFQLFGDTVNTAARMESTGVKDKIQISQDTYDILEQEGKGHWCIKRAEVVNAKGKGKMQTYWLDPSASRSSSTGDASSTHGGDMMNPSDTLVESNESYPTLNQTPEALMKRDRLVDWMVDILSEQIRKIVAMNEGLPKSFRPSHAPTSCDKRCLEEVAESIELPKFDPVLFAKSQNDASVKLQEVVVDQLRDFICIISSIYRDNPFHNFEHACHVTMATVKFLKRIVSPSASMEASSNDELASKMHRYTHGINSDPLTVLAILISALIHDVDHRGVSNVQLGKEEPQMAQYYKDKSIAEQNSLDISWDLLMSENFRELQACIFRTNDDVKRFRQVLVNVVLATDIFDKELNDLRKTRWNKAFERTDVSCDHINNLRGTIVIEHIIQASDVSHTMQHWHVYRKWNMRLFKEMYKAWTEGRMASDPSTFWYNGELGFFDNYVIPLAKKLASCNVFGVSSDECLNYAERNRAEWEDRGQEIVASMIEELKAELQ